MVECTECGAAVAEDRDACPECGASLGPTRECENCGQRIDAAEPACPACGQLAEAARCERHPERPARGQCVVCGSPVCDECDRKNVVHYACPAHHDVPIIAGWAQVYSVADDVEADLIRENLQSEGIDAEVLSQKDHALTVDFGDLSQIRLLVPAYEYDRARQVIARHMDLRGEVVFACPACGEAYEPGDDVCRACGAPLPATSA
ncbi:MAG: double zinc ribbon domain-containing protein [Longimicrobiales bacterium]